LRRIVIIGTAVAVLVGAAAAYAAYNNYAGTNLKFNPSAAGSKKKPVALGMTENLRSTAPSGDRSAPLKDIKVTIYGVKLDTGKLPVCSDAKIESNKTSALGGCSAGSKIGNGSTTALLGPGQNQTAKGTPCSPRINVFNGGPKTQVFFFYTTSATQCGGLTTGSTAPFDSHISYHNGNAVIDVPQPPDISTKVAGQPNLFGSLITQTIVYPKKVNGKGYMSGIGCKNGKRAWSITYKSQDYAAEGGSTETQTISGKSPC
jgi:hypothetical protein